MKRADPRAALRNLHDATLAIAGDRAAPECSSCASLAIVSLAALAIAAPSLAQSPVQVMIVGTYHMSNPGLAYALRDGGRCALAEAPGRTFGHRERDCTLQSRRRWTSNGTQQRRTRDTRHTSTARFRLLITKSCSSASGSQGSSILHPSTASTSKEQSTDAVEAFAKAHGEMPLLTAADSDVEAFTTKMDAVLARGTIGDALRYMNDPALVAHGNDFYRTTLKMGTGAPSPAPICSPPGTSAISTSAPTYPAPATRRSRRRLLRLGPRALLHQCVSETRVSNWWKQTTTCRTSAGGRFQRSERRCTGDASQQCPRAERPYVSAAYCSLPPGQTVELESTPRSPATPLPSTPSASPCPEPEEAPELSDARAALREARVDASEIDYINVDPTSTRLNDLMQTVAEKRVFGGSRRVDSDQFPEVDDRPFDRARLEAAATALLLSVGSSLPPEQYVRLVKCT